MNITNSTRGESLCRWAERAADLVRDRDVPAVAAIERAVAEFRDGRYLLTVLGKVNRGKSTLVNALLGRQDDSVSDTTLQPIARISREEQTIIRQLKYARDTKTSNFPKPQ